MLFWSDLIGNRVWATISLFAQNNAFSCIRNVRRRGCAPQGATGLQKFMAFLAMQSIASSSSSLTTAGLCHDASCWVTSSTCASLLIPCLSLNQWIVWLAVSPFLIRLTVSNVVASLKAIEYRCLSPSCCFILACKHAMLAWRGDLLVNFLLQADPELLVVVVLLYSSVAILRGDLSERSAESSLSPCLY